jgi:hypothetical protein
VQGERRLADARRAADSGDDDGARAAIVVAGTVVAGRGAAAVELGDLVVQHRELAGPSGEVRNGRRELSRNGRVRRVRAPREALALARRLVDPLVDAIARDEVGSGRIRQAEGANQRPQ